MRGNWIAAFVLALLLALPGTTARASGFGVNEASARAMGMAGAFTAIADGPSATFFNPAGLATLRGLQFEAGLTFLAPGNSYTGPYPETGVETTVNSTRNYFFLPNVHAAYRVHERVAVGLGLFVPYGLTSEWPTAVNINGSQVGWWGRNLIERISLQTVYITPQVAVNLHPRVQVGAGLYIVRGVVDLQQGVTFSNNPAGDVNLNLSASAMGFSGTAGLLVSVIPNLLRAGFTYRGGVKFDFSGTASFTRPNGSPDIPAGLRSQLTDGPGSTTLRTPHVFSFGLAAFPIRPLTVSFNFDVITWSDYGALAINFSPTTEAPTRPEQLNTTVPKNWSNTIVVRLGAEYKIIPSLAVRAGFIYDQSPAPRNTVGPDLPDADRYEVTLGAGYSWRDLRVDLAYQYLTTGSFSTSTTAPLVGSFTANAHLLGLSLGYALNL
jgi:long-chain fatty acid transport protein